MSQIRTLTIRYSMQTSHLLPKREPACSRLVLAHGHVTTYSPTATSSHVLPKREPTCSRLVVAVRFRMEPLYCGLGALRHPHEAQCCQCIRVEAWCVHTPSAERPLTALGCRYSFEDSGSGGRGGYLPGCGCGYYLAQSHSPDPKASPRMEMSQVRMETKPSPWRGRGFGQVATYLGVGVATTWPYRCSGPAWLESRGFRTP